MKRMRLLGFLVATTVLAGSSVSQAAVPTVEDVRTCSKCIFDDVISWHLTYGSGASPGVTNGHAGWGPGACISSHHQYTHESCGSPNLVSTAFIVAVAAAGDFDQLADMARQPTTGVSFNEQRNAFQVAGCDGSITANIPVPTRLDD